VRSSAPFGLSHPSHFEGEGHILEHREMGEQGIMLEHHGCPATQGRKTEHALATNADITRGRGLMPGHQAQQGRLAAATWAEQAAITAVWHMQINPFNGQGLAESLADIDEFKVASRRHGQWFSSSGGLGSVPGLHAQTPAHAPALDEGHRRQRQRDRHE
jgi:hypothetical protein